MAFHGKRATSQAGMQPVGTPHWNLPPENPAISVWRIWSKRYYFYCTSSFLSYHFPCVTRHLAKQTEDWIRIKNYWTDLRPRFQHGSAFFSPLQNPCPAAHGSAHTAPGITFEPLLFFGRSSDTAHKAGHMCREPGRSRGRSPGSCLRPEASVKPLFSCFHYNRFWHFSKCTTALSHHIWTDILHLSSALLPSVSEP